MDSCSYTTLVAQTQSFTSKKIEFIDEDNWPFSHLSIILHLSVGIFWPSFDPFLSLMFLMDGRLGFRATTIDFLKARPPQLVSATGHMASVSYYRYHVLFCKIQVRQQSGWSYLLWQPCDECIVKALMTWNKNAQKQFHPTVQGLLHKPPSLYGKENNVISKICHSKYLPYIQPSITKGWENWAPEVAIFVSTVSPWDAHFGGNGKTHVALNSCNLSY